MTSAREIIQFETDRQISGLKADYALQKTIFWNAFGQGVPTVAVLDTGSTGENGNFIDLRFMLKDLGMVYNDIERHHAAEFNGLGHVEPTLGTVELKVFPVFNNDEGQRIGRPNRVTFHVLEEPIFGDALLGRDYCKKVYGNRLEALFLEKAKPKLTEGTPLFMFAPRVY